jgi:transposase
MLMSLNAPLFYLIPEDTVRVAKAAFPKGNLFMRMRDELGPLYQNQDFAHLFPATGQPALDPARLALVLVMQFVDGLSDRQAADAVRDRIAWKYALALPLDDPGFDASVLSEFRSRLVDGGAEYLLLDTMLTLLREQGLLKARGRQRTDATHVLAAIRVLNRLVLVGETLRHALNELAEVAPNWLRALSPPEWFVRYARRIDDYHLPKGKAEREALAATIGADGLLLLNALAETSAPTAARSLAAVTTLRWVWIQQFYAPHDDDSGRPSTRWRSDADLPPAGKRIHSPYDLQARHASKGDLSWVGYKAHLSEACDEELPHLITHVVTTPASTHDSHVVEPLHAALQKRDLVPAEHLLDAGYVDTQLLVESEQDFGIELIGPVAPDRSWQAKANKGFALACFRVNWEAQRVSCPQGRTSVSWSERRTGRGEQVIEARFSKLDCCSCPSQTECVKSAEKAREIRLRPREEFEALQQARQRQQSPEWKRQNAARAGIEGTISQGVRRCDLHHARYIGLARTRLQHILVAIALNLVRLYAWWTEQPRRQVKPSKFAKLALAGS